MRRKYNLFRGVTLVCLWALACQEAQGAPDFEVGIVQSVDHNEGGGGSITLSYPGGETRTYRVLKYTAVWYFDTPFPFENVQPGWPAYVSPRGNTDCALRVVLFPYVP